MYFRKRKRLLFGAVDIGYRIEHYTRFIEENFDDHLKVESFSKYVVPESHFKTSYTYTCPIDKKSSIYLYFYTFFFFLRALFNYDVVHFFSGETILPWKLRGFELFMYRLFGKKVIMHFVGADIRSEKYLVEKNDNLEAFLNDNYVFRNALSEPFQKTLIRQARKFATAILVSTPDLLTIIPEATYLPVFIDLENIPIIPTQNHSKSKLVILHSPSGYNTKGSDYIHSVLDRIKVKYGSEINIEMPGKGLKQLKKNYALSRYEIFEKMNNADIVIDQMLIGWYGLKSVEALFLGCEVICYIDKDVTNWIKQDNPIINASILDLESKLTRLIDSLLLENDQLSRETSNKKFILENHSIASYKDVLAKIWFYSNKL